MNKMNLGRLNQRLDKPLNINPRWKSSTLREIIEGNNYSEVEAIEVPRIKYNRVKFNRMWGDEQQEYKRKLEETKTEYYIYSKCGNYQIKIGKMVFDYVQSRRSGRDS